MDDEDELELFLEQLSESSDPAEMAAYAIYMSIVTHSYYGDAFNKNEPEFVVQLIEDWIKILRETMSL